MRTDKEAREIAALWKFLFDLAEALRVERIDRVGLVAGADALEDLKKHIKDTAAAYGTKL